MLGMKTSRRKRLFLSALSLCLLVLLIWGAWRLWTKHEERILKQQIDQVNQRMDKLYQTEGVRRSSRQLTATLLVAYYPQLNGQDIKPIQEKIAADYKQFDKGDALREPENLVFYSSQSTETSLANVNEVKLERHEFPLSKGSVGKEQKAQLAHFYLKKDGQELTLNHLFKDEAGAKAIIVQKIKESLSKDQLAQTNTQKIVQELEKGGLSQWQFDYSASKFIIKLPRTVASTSQVEVPLAQLYDQIDVSYLKGQDLQAYQDYQANKQKKLVALTFDDGPNPATTPKALDILAKYHAKGTFFMLGQAIAGNEKLVKRVQQEGHEIGNHSWSHPRLPSLPLAQAQKEIEDTQTAIARVTGQRPRLIRPPYGEFNASLCGSLDLSFILWDVDSLDWQSHRTDAILEQVKKQVKDGSIILMHDIHQTTIDALPTVIDYLQKNGYRLVTVSDLLGQKLQGHQVYYNAN